MCLYDGHGDMLLEMTTWSRFFGIPLRFPEAKAGRSVLKTGRYSEYVTNLSYTGHTTSATCHWLVTSKCGTCGTELSQLWRPQGPKGLSFNCFPVSCFTFLNSAERQSNQRGPKRCHFPRIFPPFANNFETLQLTLHRALHVLWRWEMSYIFSSTFRISSRGKGLVAGERSVWPNVTWMLFFSEMSSRRCHLNRRKWYQWS